MEDYRKKYEEALGRARTFNQRWQSIEATDSELALKELKEIFPELKENEDEDKKARESLLKYLKESFNFDGEIIYPEVANWIAWLEKQTIDISSFPEEQRKYMEKYVNLDKTTLVKLLAERDENIDESLKASTCNECEHPTLNCGNFPCDKVKPKFKVGDWVIWDNKIPCHVDNIYQGKNSLMYTITDTNNMNRSYSVKGFDNNAHLWTIQDAKDGDVLVNGSNIFIFHCIDTTRLMGYCHVNTDDGKFYDDIGKNECFCLIDAVVIPASKEQRALLFSKMKEAGYEWDPEKKEVKQIEQKPVPITDWIEDYWQHHKVTNPDSYNVGEEIQFDHDSFIRFCNKYFQKPAWSEEDEMLMDELESYVLFNEDFNNDQKVWRIKRLKSIKLRMKGE